MSMVCLPVDFQFIRCVEHVAFSRVKFNYLLNMNAIQQNEATICIWYEVYKWQYELKRTIEMHSP